MKATIEQLQEKLQLEPDNAELHYQLGMALQEKFPGYTPCVFPNGQTGAELKGMKEVEKATELDPMNYTYMHALAMLHERRADYNTADRFLQRCVELNPKAKGLYEDRVRVVNKIKAERERYSAHAREQFEKNPEDADALSNLGYTYGEERKFDEAFIYLNKAIAAGGDKVDNYSLIAMFNYRAKRYEDALAAYKKMLKYFVPEQPDEDDLNDPDYQPDTNAGIHVSIADCYVKLNDLDSADKHYRKALQADPGYVDINLYLAYNQETRGNYQQALDLYLEVLPKLDAKRHKTIDESIGLCYYHLGDLAEAKTWLEKCIKKNPAYSSAYYNLGVVYDRMGDGEGTEMVLQMAIQANQGDMVSLYHLARIYKDKGYYRDALELLEKALYRNPLETTVMELRAEIYAGMGDSERAEMEADMAQYIKDLRAGKPMEFDDENEEEDYDDEEDD